ncbi:hypothetical protein ACH5RR_039911 [Cinchona calisaya]|uniref:PGG domain-containing protein n=1 Tax=Cinchona calisaya TaxID=153742 RepID=A0ABD2Y018_9GENT
MEKNLYAAALEGDITTFLQLLAEDHLLLEKAILNCEDKNPLHLAAMMGHVDFIEAILQLNDSSSYYYHMCLARDRNGRNPLQLAVIYGKLDVLRVLLHNDGFQAALEKTEGFICKLCVKFNQQQALEMLIKAIKDPEFINDKNEDGMTMLHLDIYYKQYMIIMYFLLRRSLFPKNMYIRVKIRNANGKTAIDLLLAKRDIDGISRSTLECLEMSARLEDKDVHSPHEWLEKFGDTVMIVASLIATMAFQTGLSPPGGVWQDDLKEGPNPHKIGEAVMAQTHPKYYKLLMVTNTIAFVSSLWTIIMLIGVLTLRNKKLMQSLAFAMWLAVATIAITYAVSLVTIAPKDARGKLSEASEIAVIVLLVWSGWIVTAVRESNCL